MLFIKLYVTAIVLFLLMDFVWLGVIAASFYKEQIGFLMTDQVRWGAAMLFYSLYVVGLVFFAIMPALKEGSWVVALCYGAFFGLICYATYDLTNLATLKNWPLKLTLYDMLWGASLSGTTALLTYLLANHWKKFFS